MVSDIPEWLAELSERKGDAIRAFTDLRDEVFEEGVLSRREKRLMMLAAATAVGCDRCVRHHSQEAQGEGFSRDEIAEATLVGVLVRAGSGLGYASAALEEEE